MPISETLKDRIEKEITLGGIFWPHGMYQRANFYNHPKIGENPSARFVHYTSAENALRIIRSKRIWMRNTICMADYSEVLHGFNILKNFFNVEEKVKGFLEALDVHFAGAAHEAINLFNQWWNDIRHNTYITSISEHDPLEDFQGRLSMWRAFGGNGPRVALVLRIPWIMESDARQT